MPEDDRFDYGEAFRRRDDGIERAEGGVLPIWKQNAISALQVTARRRREFIVDDVWEVGGLPETRENRALGAVMQRGVREGWIENTGRRIPSARKTCHGNYRTVWRSLVYGEPEMDSSLERRT